MSCASVGSICSLLLSRFPVLLVDKPEAIDSPTLLLGGNASSKNLQVGPLSSTHLFGMLTKRIGHCLLRLLITRDHSAPPVHRAEPRPGPTRQRVARSCSEIGLRARSREEYLQALGLVLPLVVPFRAPTGHVVARPLWCTRTSRSEEPPALSWTAWSFA
jgi:hypothetical protein